MKRHLALLLLLGCTETTPNEPALVLVYSDQDRWPLRFERGGDFIYFLDQEGELWRLDPDEGAALDLGLSGSDLDATDGTVALSQGGKILLLGPSGAILDTPFKSEYPLVPLFDPSGRLWAVELVRGSTGPLLSPDGDTGREVSRWVEFAPDGDVAWLCPWEGLLRVGPPLDTFCEAYWIAEPTANPGLDVNLDGVYAVGPQELLQPDRGVVPVSPRPYEDPEFLGEVAWNRAGDGYYFLSRPKGDSSGGRHWRLWLYLNPE